MHALIAANLIDEYRMLIFPTILGADERLFPGGGKPAYLECLSAEQHGAAVLARYARTRPGNSYREICPGYLPRQGRSGQVNLAEITQTGIDSRGRHHSQGRPRPAGPRRRAGTRQPSRSSLGSLRGRPTGRSQAAHSERARAARRSGIETVAVSDRNGFRPGCGPELGKDIGDVDAGGLG